MAKALRFTVAFCGASVIAYAGYLAWSFAYGVEAERSPFSPAAWKEKANVYAHSNDPGCVRGGMALDLAPFGRWTLRDKAAQRRSALR